MKKNRLIFMLCMSAAVFTHFTSSAQLKLIHYWTFNKANTPSDGSGGIQLSPYSADYSTIGGAWVAYKKVTGTVKDTAIMDNYITTDSVPAGSHNRRSGFGGCCSSPNYSVRARNPSDSMQMLWYIPTNGYKDIVIKYETLISSTSSGQAAQLFSYSVDSGSTWLTAGLNVTIDSTGIKAWHLDSINLSAVTAANNNSKFVFRIKFRTHNTGTSGNNRFDNVTVEGDTNIIATGIAQTATDSHGYNLYPNPAGDNISITAPTDAAKLISIFNALGQGVYASEQQGKQIPISTSQLSKGFYYVNIKELSNGSSYTLKLMKN